MLVRSVVQRASMIGDVWLAQFDLFLFWFFYVSCVFFFFLLQTQTVCIVFVYWFFSHSFFLSLGCVLFTLSAMHSKHSVFMFMCQCVCTAFAFSVHTTYILHSMCISILCIYIFCTYLILLHCSMALIPRLATAFTAIRLWCCCFAWWEKPWRGHVLNKVFCNKLLSIGLLFVLLLSLFLLWRCHFRGRCFSLDLSLSLFLSVSHGLFCSVTLFHSFRCMFFNIFYDSPI